MKKLMTIAAATLLGISMIGCAGEKKPAAPAAPAPGAPSAPETGTPPAEPAPAATEEKK